MALAIVSASAFLLVVCLVLFLVHQLRPGVFKCKIMLTKWASIDLEMRSPTSSSASISKSLEEAEKEASP
jgi:hypothetical protein